jgi:DNA-binding SARP family transcriptional activator
MPGEFRLLGGIEVTVDGRAVDVGHARQQCVLVALLLDANTVVTVDQLIERV